MKQLKHGGDISGFAEKSGCSRDDVMDFSSNINPLGFSRGMRDAFYSSFQDVSRYPDPNATQLCRVIAHINGLEPANVLAGNGSIALIDLVIRCIQPRTALLVEPCFNEYRRRLEASRVDIEHVQSVPEHDFQIPFEEILEKLPGIDLVVIGHPNNPTGTALNAEKLMYVMNAVKERGKFILIDEAFIDWNVADSVIQHVEQYPSSVVIRSMTKFYALAGIRAGYACASKPFIEHMRSFQETWSCNCIAQKLALAGLRDKQFQSESRRWFHEESNFMKQSLDDIPFLKVFPSKANFFLCKINHPSLLEQFWPMVMRACLYLREAEDFVGLDRSYFRLALKTRDENIRLVQVMEKMCLGRKRNDRNILGVYR